MLYNKDILSVSLWALQHTLTHLCKDSATLILSFVISSPLKYNNYNFDLAETK